MGASLSTAERRVLEAAHDAGGGHVPGPLTDVVRRMVGQLTGQEFRRAVADLSERQLLRASVATKVNGEVGQVVIVRITRLGRRAIGR